LQPVPADRLADAQHVADHLVKIGKLSRFQATKLLQGATLGLVLGPYHVLSPIGKGGMGSVFLARDTRSQTLVAVKVLPPKRAKEEERLLVRFRREMEICRKVSHPHITRTFEAGVHEGVNYIAMEFIPGRNLYKLVTEDGPLAVPRAARLFQEISLGLEHAHGQGLIHRDMKPSNVMVTTDDHAKVLDLGLALIQGEIGADRTVVGGQGYVVGTLDYLAPEQADDALAVDPRCDIYSLGCTLYFALTKSPPFPGGNALQKLLRHRCDEPAPLAQLNPTVPPEFVAVVKKMMAKQREERYASAAECRAALAPWAPPGAAKASTEPPPKQLPLNKEAQPPLSSPRRRTPSPKSEITPPDAPKPAKGPPESWFVDMAKKGGPPTVPSPAPPAAPPAVHPVEVPDLPFWADYLLPVGVGGAVLFVAWLVGLVLLLRR
jgi:serine/threonine protein kinase